MKRLEKLLINGTGYSIKSWFLYGVTLTGIALLAITGFVLVWDVLEDGTVSTNIGELSQFVAAVSGLFVAAGLPKIVGEIMEKKNENKREGNSTDKAL